MRSQLRVAAGIACLAIAHGLATANPTIAIKGSNTFGEELGPLLLTRYKAIEPAVTFSLETQGSSSGITALFGGECDIASTSRTLTEDERRLAKSRGLKLNTYVIGYYGVAVIVNAQNPVHRLSDRQVRDIFSGKLSTWSAVGGASGSIHVLTREKSAGAYLGFQELAMERLAYAVSAEPCRSDLDIVGKISADQNAIGYVNFARLKEKGIQPVAINHAMPTRWEVNQNTYPYARGLRFYTAAGKETDATKQYIDFVRSKAGQQIVNGAGFVGFAEVPLLPAAVP